MGTVPEVSEKLETRQIVDASWDANFLSSQVGIGSSIQNLVGEERIMDKISASVIGAKEWRLGDEGL